MGIPEFAIDAATGDALARMRAASSGTCSVVLELPLLDRVVLANTPTRATEACESADLLYRGERTFVEHLAEAHKLVPVDLSVRPRYEAWRDSIPAWVSESVHNAVYAVVPPGHKCREGGPHVRVTLKHFEYGYWRAATRAKVAPLAFVVFLVGPGPK